MDEAIKTRTTKPVIRLVLADATSCIGCDRWPSISKRAGFVDCAEEVGVVCYQNGKAMHIKHVGELPSTR